MTTATFRVSTDILQRLGEELITTFDQGIIELVKNSYDADALSCTVELWNTDKSGGSLVISDNGRGMTSEDILEGWLILGRSMKSPRERTPLNRLPAGSKGIGRLASLRMGDEVLLVTRPTEEPGAEYSIRIRWDDYARHDVVEDVELDIRRSNTTQGQGTRVEIRDLRDRITRREVQRLAREMILLSDPFGDPTGFNLKLVAPEFGELESLVTRAYFDDCEFRLLAHLDQSGKASAKVFDRSGAIRWRSEENAFIESYTAPAATFELWIYLLRSQSFAGRSTTIREIRNWLRQVGGVHLYHRGLRVRPYGDPGHDWLDMNLSRVRDPELRPSTNTSVGRVTVLDEDLELLQRTDRTGFIENEAFRELRRFAFDALEWMQSMRLDERERIASRKKQASNRRAKRAKANLNKAIESLPPSDRPKVQQAASELESARETESGLIREELGIYKTVASVGTAISVFAHEIEGPATDLTISIKAVGRRARKILGSEYESSIGGQLDSAEQSAGLIARFATLPLSLLKRSKRRRTIVDINNAVSEIISLFLPYLQDAKVETTLDLSEANLQVQGSVAAIEAIVSNLITNAVKAFKRKGARLTHRQIIVRTQLSGGHVLICVLDSGPGIDERLGERIWLPGVTSDEDGIGLGLKIVWDTVTELGGQAKAINQSELGGAEFIIELPFKGLEP